MFNVKAPANEETLLRKHCCGRKCFPVCARTQHLLQTQKMFLNFFRNILRPQQMLPRLFLRLRGKEANICFASHSFARRGNITSNNVSATMFPRLRGPLILF